MRGFLLPVAQDVARDCICKSMQHLHPACFGILHEALHGAGYLEREMKQQYKQHHRTPTYLLAAGRAGVEVIGTTVTSAPIGTVVRYGFEDQYGFNVLGQAIVSRDWKWHKPAFNVRHYEVQEN